LRIADCGLRIADWSVFDLKSGIDNQESTL
jgi:hypothetical protein